MTPENDHPLRYQTVNELHARPFPALDVPCTAVVLAFKEPSDAANRDRALDRAHLADLLRRHAGTPPEPDASHYSGSIGRAELKWESHTEFVTYSAFLPGVSDRPFDPAEAGIFPKDWVGAAPGRRLVAILVRVEEMPATLDQMIAQSEGWFVPESLALSRVVDGAAVIAGDFRIDAAGYMRFAVFVRPGTGRRRVGRIVQRLCEIETYRAMSMLGLVRARELAAELNRVEPRLAALVAGLDRPATDAAAEPADLHGVDLHGANPVATQSTTQINGAEAVLHDLLSISSALERLAVRVSFRFGATAAYEAILHQRIAVLREERVEGRQTFGEFMMRRYDPAMRTVKSAGAQLTALSERAERAGELLRTRVDVERSAQNQKVLESMDKRADLQLRLQHTVEGLSVVAISYYAVSLASYALYPLAKLVGMGKEILTAALVLPVIGLVWLAVRRIKSRFH